MRTGIREAHPATFLIEEDWTTYPQTFHDRANLRSLWSFLRVDVLVSMDAPLFQDINARYQIRVFWDPMSSG
jgi:hypothetical protein